MESKSPKPKTPVNPNLTANVARALKAGKQVVIVVSRQPSIDQLVAAISLASLINKQSTPNKPVVDKAKPQEGNDSIKLGSPNAEPNSRANRNAVVAFGGPIHPKIGFLKTDKIITQTITNYRELVVAIDKNKADKLRYSLDQKLARVHISPFSSYEKGLAAEDLEIEHGDFNIDVLVAIGVNETNDLEPMISDHLELLKKRQTITLTAGSEKPSHIFDTKEQSIDSKTKPETKKAVDSNKAKKPQKQPINWSQTQACCLSEMVFDLAQEMGFELDETIASIILTGFLAATDRVKSRTAGAEKIEMIGRLVKLAGIDNKQLIIDYLENEKLQLKAAPEPARQAAATTAKKSDREQLLTEQEATRQQRIVDPGTVRIKSGLGLRVADLGRVQKTDEKVKISLTDNLDDIQIDKDGHIIPVAVNSNSIAIETNQPTETPPATNPVVDADKLGQAVVANSIPVPEPNPEANKQQFQPSLIPGSETSQAKPDESNVDLTAAGQAAA